MFFAPILHVLFGELWSKGINTQGGFPGRLDVHQWVSPNAPLLRGPLRAYAEFLGHRCVAVWLGTANWFTASSLFGNPAIGIAQSLLDTFSGIRPVDVSGFVVAELAGALTTL